MLHWLMRGAMIGLISFMGLLLAPAAHAMETLDHAAVRFRTADDSAFHSLDDVKLPYSWDSLHGAVRGEAQFSLEFRSTDTSSSQAIYIQRVGNVFEVTLNGVRIAKAGTPGNDEDHSKKPQFIPIPSGVLKERNTLQIAIHAQEGRIAGLSPVVIGLENEVRQGYESSYRIRVSASLVVCIISSVLATLSLLLWFRQRESLYVFYGLSELLWAVHLSDVQFEHPPLPWPWWGMVIWSAYGMAPALISKFTLAVVERHDGLLKRLTDLYLLLTIPVVMFARLAGWLWLWPLWKAIVVLLCMSAGVVVVRHGIRSNSWEKRILAIAVIATVAASLRDLFYFVILPNISVFSGHANANAYVFEVVSWVRYLWVAYAITLAWIIAERLRKSTQAVARMNRTLAERLNEREAELETMYRRQADVERQQAMQEERQRLTRDMHDGLGSQLLGALHLAQNPEVPRDTLALQLRDALDQLKLTVDAMQDTEGDIPTLLGALRYRLGPRLEAAGVQLAWEVEHLPAMEGWTLQHSRDLQMLLFEAFSNIIVHARASQACLRAVTDTAAGCIRITLGDNGGGFAADGAQGGHGIRNMRARAARLGADLQIQASAEGTQVVLGLPVGS